MERMNLLNKLINLWNMEFKIALQVWLKNKQMHKTNLRLIKQHMDVKKCVKLIVF